MEISQYIPPAAALKASDSMQYYGTLGDYVGGVIGTIVSILGFAAVIWTLLNARKYEYRSKVYQVFTEMLRTHEDIVQSLSFKGKSGRDVFGEILDEFYQIHDLLSAKGHFSNTAEATTRAQIAYLVTYYGPQSATAELLSDLKLHSQAIKLVEEIDGASVRFAENKFVKELKAKAMSADPAEVAWKADISALRALFATQDIPPKTRQLLLRTLNSASHRIAPLTLDQVKDRIKLLAGNSYFTGHQNRLGHYFRNLYAIYRYLDDSTIPADERDRLGKVIRSKMSNYEQAVLALNALTPLGKSWRYGRFSLMKRYMPIRAVPKGFFGFDPNFVLHEIYPEVRFEWQDLKVDA